MDSRSVKALVAQSRGDSPTLNELASTFVDEDLRAIGSGRELARSFAATLRVREATTRNAGIDAAGITEAIATLTRMGHDEHIVIFHFATSTRLFSVLLSDDARIVGCLRVVTAGRKSPTEP